MIYFSSAQVITRISKQYPIHTVNIIGGFGPTLFIMKARTYHKAIYSLFLFEGAYFVITGIWPILNMSSFMIATGPKQDTWLVEMVGLLAVSIGLTFLVSALRRKHLPILLAYSSSFSFLAMDIIYVAKGVIQHTYLLDAAIQFAFLTCLTFFVIRKQLQTT